MYIRLRGSWHDFACCYALCVFIDSYEGCHYRRFHFRRKLNLFSTSSGEKFSSNPSPTLSYCGYKADVLMLLSRSCLQFKIHIIFWLLRFWRNLLSGNFRPAFENKTNLVVIKCNPLIVPFYCQHRVYVLSKYDVFRAKTDYIRLQFLQFCSSHHSQICFVSFERGPNIGPGCFLLSKFLQVHFAVVPWNWPKPCPVSSFTVQVHSHYHFILKVQLIINLVTKQL